jgi:hypothetical protein
MYDFQNKQTDWPLNVAFFSDLTACLSVTMKEDENCWTDLH